MKIAGMVLFLGFALLTLTLVAVAEADQQPANASAPTVTLKVDPDQIDFLIGKELVTRFHKGEKVAKPYAWPVNGKGGVPLTRAWPMEKAQPGGSTDHVHQKSAWFCHGDVIPEGLTLKAKVKGVEGVDFWSEAPAHGRIVCTKVESPVLKPGEGRITTVNQWVTFDGTKILDEKRTITLYDMGPARLFVFDIDLQANDMPITFGDTKEGAFGVRVNDLIRAPEPKAKKATGKEDPSKQRTGRIENADGKVGEKACWGQLSAWCNYSGTIDGKKVGIAILDDPANKYPACWHSRAYGLMAANPFGRGKSGFPAMKGRTDLVKLAKGEHLRLRYGLLLHPSDAKEGKVADYFQRFIKLRDGKAT
jgi:hypothetical protein